MFVTETFRTQGESYVSFDSTIIKSTGDVASSPKRTSDVSFNFSVVFPCNSTITQAIENTSYAKSDQIFNCRGLWLHFNRSNICKASTYIQMNITLQNYPSTEIAEINEDMKICIMLFNIISVTKEFKYKHFQLYMDYIANTILFITFYVLVSPTNITFGKISISLSLSNIF